MKAPIAFSDHIRNIVKGWTAPYLIVGGYVAVMIITVFAPREIVGVAYDSGGVTTSTVTVLLVTALGVGRAATVRGRNPLVDGFGLIAFASLLPMVFVRLYAWFFFAESRVKKNGFGLIAFASVFPIMTVMGYAQIAQWMARRKPRAAREA